MEQFTIQISVVPMCFYDKSACSTMRLFINTWVFIPAYISVTFDPYRLLLYKEGINL